MRDFTQARVDHAIAASKYLSGRVHPSPPIRAVDRAGLKRFAGTGLIYFRGAERTQLATVDADMVLLDEYELVPEHVFSLAEQRIASSRAGLIRVASTPNLPESGINGLYLRSDQRRYLLPCPRCHGEQPLTWPDSVDMSRALIVCSIRSCRAPMDLWAEGRWEATAPGNSQVHGYHLSRLYSPRADIVQVIQGVQAGDAAR